MSWLALIVLCGPVGCAPVNGLPAFTDHDSCVNALAIARQTLEATAQVAGGPGALMIRGWCVEDDGVGAPPAAPSVRDGGDGVPA